MKLKDLLSESILGDLPSSKLIKMKWNPLTGETLSEGDYQSHELMCMEYIKKFSETADHMHTFDYVGVKDDIYVYTADLTNLGELGLVISKAKVVGLCSKKHAMFGVVYTLAGLEVKAATVCKIKKTEKDGQTSLETIAYDADDNKNFNKEDINFKKYLK